MTPPSMPFDRRKPVPMAVRRAAILAGADGLALVAAMLLASVIMVMFSPYAVDHGWGDRFTHAALSRLLRAGLIAAALLGWCAHKGHYTRRLPFWITAGQVCGGAAIALLVEGFWQYSMKAEFSRLWLLNTWLLAVPALLLARMAARRLLRALGWWAIPVLAVGSPQHTAQIAALLHQERGLGYVTAAQIPLTGAAQDWAGLGRRHGAEAILLAADQGEMIRHETAIARLAWGDLPLICVQVMAGLPVDSLESYHLIGQDMIMLFQRNRLDWWGRALKAAFDRGAAAILLVLASPLLLTVAALTAADCRPVLYAHGRIGRGGRPFQCLKFRTMAVDADARLAALLAADAAAAQEWRDNHKLRHDPRVTALGRFLRQYSLDELPQLWNVLMGHMSLVGPRPISPQESHLLGDAERTYHAVQPGITGLWQVSGRSDLSYPERVRLNAWYIRNWSLWLDIVILLRTIPAIVLRRGAC